MNDHATGRVHRLSAASYAVVGAMDGTRTVDRLWEEAVTRLEEDAPSQDDMIRLLAQLNASDLLQTEGAPDSFELLNRAAKIQRSRWWQGALNPLAVRMRLWYPEQFFVRTIPMFRWLFSWSGAALWIVVVLPAIVLAAQNWPALSDGAQERLLAPGNLLILALSYPVLKALHELGHGFAVKAFSGTVHEIGVLFLVFMPVPYVDASGASEFRSKWRRVVVGAAGMIVEVFIAALALYVWLSVEQGIVRTLAYNVMLIAGISTVLFNGNPLLRYDGYYILSDLLEIPNLAVRATRYWGYLIERYVFRTEGSRDFAAAPGERPWLFLYAPLSFAYRLLVMFAIALFISSEYLAVGAAIAVWGLFIAVVLPVGKALHQLFTSPRLHRNRARAALTTFASVVVALIALVWIPAPSYSTSEGVVWLSETAIVRAGTDGFIRDLLVAPGNLVSTGTPLLESEERTVKAELEILLARVAELEGRLAAERFADRVKAEITTTELGYARDELVRITGRAERLVTRSRAEGVFTVMKPQDLPGRFVREGQIIGYVVPPGSRTVRALIQQDDIDLVRSRLRRILVLLAERLDDPLPARIIREVPAGREDLPSKALGGFGGGVIAVDPRDPQGTKALQRVFQIDLELSPEAAATAFGSRAYVRFDYEWEPLGQQMWRRVRQLLLARLQL